MAGPGGIRKRIPMSDRKSQDASRPDRPSRAPLLPAMLTPLAPATGIPLDAHLRSDALLHEPIVPPASRRAPRVNRERASQPKGPNAPRDGEPLQEPFSLSTFRLAHHFASPEQQISVAKLGMWLFIATELMMFGGLFCLYAVFRNLHPAAFRWGAGLQDLGWGVINTTMLLLSSLTIALAVHCARTGQRQLLMLFLSLTMVCGIGFLGVKVIEYRHKIESGLLWGESFQPAPPAPQSSATEPMGAAHESHPHGGTGGKLDPERGRQIFMSSCAACHGPGGEGMDRIGLPLRGSEFVAGSTQEGLIAFLKVGREANDPQSRMNALMPPRGGNPFMTDQEVALVAAYVRSLNGEAPGGDTDAGTAAGSRAVVTEADVIEAMVPRWIGTPKPLKDTGLAPEFLAPDIRPLPEIHGPGAPPPHAATYFAIYFLMTGLHGVHLLIGLGVVGWLLVRASRWQFGAAYNTPVEMGGLYWHLVDLVWIVLFPLLYLVH